MFGARAGDGEWAASLAAWPTLEPTQPDLGRKGTEVNLRLPPALRSSLSGPESPTVQRGDGSRPALRGHATSFLSLRLWISTPLHT